MIDKETFRTTYDLFDKEVVCEIIDIYIAEHPDRMKNLTAAVENCDFDALNKHAHSLKGVIANFYDDVAYHHAKALEMKGKSQEIEGAAELLAELKSSSTLLLEELKEIKKSYL
ncbi:MAG TPA: Hpt domain-containing protein [Bacteroidales bacterium]|jgi:HPt (histidine-containing phosphotransfer) domain-containing protein|nr:Hpt domain-containing protein [Bacteroidales bacterium]